MAANYTFTTIKLRKTVGCVGHEAHLCIIDALPIVSTSYAKC